jgi:hypothetical protein
MYVSIISLDLNCHLVNSKKKNIRFEISTEVNILIVALRIITPKRLHDVTMQNTMLSRVTKYGIRIGNWIH